MFSISKLLRKNWKSILTRLEVCLIKDKQTHIFRPQGITPVSSININKTNVTFSFNTFTQMEMKNFQDVFTFNCANPKFIFYSTSFLEAFPECKLHFSAAILVGRQTCDVWRRVYRNLISTTSQGCWKWLHGEKQ